MKQIIKLTASAKNALEINPFIRTSNETGEYRLRGEHITLSKTEEDFDPDPLTYHIYLIEAKTDYQVDLMLKSILVNILLETTRSLGDDDYYDNVPALIYEALQFIKALVYLGCAIDFDLLNMLWTPILQTYGPDEDSAYDFPEKLDLDYIQSI